MLAGSTPPSRQPRNTSDNDRVQDIRVSVCLEDGTPVAAELVELARMDLMLRVDRPLRFSTPIRLVLFRDFSRGVAHCRAVVHWCRTERGCWKLGAFLTTPIADCITDRCGAELRAHLRYPAGWKSWIRIDDTGQLERALIVDYSVAGVCTSLPCAVEPGKQLSLFGSGSTVNSPEIPARVQWCRPHQSGFMMGCFIASQRGKDLPRIFENHDAIHASETSSDVALAANDPGHLRWIEQTMQEHFLPVEPIPQPPQQTEQPQKRLFRLEPDHSGAWNLY
jgi:hypothetical protein